MARQPKSTTFSGWPGAQRASTAEPTWPVSVPETAYPASSAQLIGSYWMEPAKPPLPRPWYLLFQAEAGGSQSSKRMSESAVGLMVPSTRQNGKDSETTWEGTCPTMLNGGLILPAAVTQASPTFMPARLSQLAAAACPAPNEHEASQTKAAAAIRCADRMVSLPDIFDGNSPIGPGG